MPNVATRKGTYHRNANTTCDVIGLLRLQRAMTVARRVTTLFKITNKHGVVSNLLFIYNSCIVYEKNMSNQRHANTHVCQATT